MMKTCTCCLAALVLLMTACAPKKEPIPPLPVMENSGKMIVYQMMTRLFGNTVSTNKRHGTIEENGVGKFNDISDTALLEIKKLGITHVWFTGVIEHAVLTDYTKFGIPLDDADVVKGRAGSPYAIKDYYDVNPDLAVDVPNRMKEFEALVERTHKNGLKVLIDFVPNHVARGYRSDAKPDSVKDLGADDDKSVAFKASNNFYYLPGQSFQVPNGFNSLGAENSFQTKDGKFQETPAKVTGNNQFTASPGINEWFETIKLNYGVDIQGGDKKYFDPIPDTWRKMLDILLYWTAKGVDGFRCDMASMVPVEFWNWAIPQVKAKSPGIIFIAEIYEPPLYRNYIQTGHFDFLYDKVQLYDTLKDLIHGKKSALDIAVIQESLKDINSQMLHFLENHDEQRIASSDFAGNPWKAVPLMVVSALVDRGPVMIYFGQEVGEPGTGNEGFGGEDGRTTIFDYWGVPEHQKWVNGGKYDGGMLSEDQKKLRAFYAAVLSIAQRNEAATQGLYFDLTQANVENGMSDKVHVFIRASEGERLLIVSNFSAVQQKVKVVITNEVAAQLRLSEEQSYKLKDILWGNYQLELKSLTAEVELPETGAYVFTIQ